MLTIKEASEQLNLFGITATEQKILMWIETGFLEAESYKIHPKDLTEFIIKKKTEQFTAELEQSRHENTKLNEQLDIMNTRLHIEQSKVRTLKKMLNAQIESSHADPSELEDLLGLKKNTSSQGLKKEFKKILKALHPDRGGDERLFKVFREHYENLK